MNEPTLAEMIDGWLYGEEGVVNSEHLRAFHASLKALAEKWQHDECDSFILESLHLLQTEPPVPRYCRTCLLLALLGDLKP
jgi:hypothetical protein